jgi:hypothetical protein
MTKIVDMEFPRPSTLNPKVPPELDDITLRALERSPEKRYQTAQEMRDALERFLRSKGELIGETEIGALVDSLFADEHEDVKRDIKVYMERLGSERGLAVSSPGQPLDETASERLRVLGRAGADPSRDSPAGFAISESSRSLRAVRTSSSSHRPPPENHGWGLRIAAAVAVSGLFLTGIVGMRSASTHGAGASPSPSVLASAASAPSRAPVVRVVVRASPADATIDVDGAEVQNPFIGTFTRDDVDHRVHVAHAGYAPVTKLARFDRDDVNLDLTLEKVPEPSTSASAASLAKPSAAGARPAPSGPPGRKQPKLDDDPWR